MLQSVSGPCADRATGNRGDRGALSGGEGYVVHYNGCSCRVRQLRILHNSMRPPIVTELFISVATHRRIYAS
jgi:hypothetical protein